MSQNQIPDPSNTKSPAHKHPNQDSRGTGQLAAAETEPGANIQQGDKGRIDRDDFEGGGRQAGGDVRSQPSEQALRPPENREAARQGNPPSSSYSSANRQGAEQMRAEAAQHPGSEYLREQNEAAQRGTGTGTDTDTGTAPGTGTRGGS